MIRARRAGYRFEREAAETEDSVARAERNVTGVHLEPWRPLSCHRGSLEVDEAAEDLDHLMTPQERLRVAMARQ